MLITKIHRCYILMYFLHVNDVNREWTNNACIVFHFVMSLSVSLAVSGSDVEVSVIK